MMHHRNMRLTATVVKKIGCIATPKVSFTCEVSDETGTLPVTAFNEEVGKLFRFTTADIFKMLHSDDDGWFVAIADRLLKHRFLLQVGPKTTLYRNRVLQWGLRKVVVDEAVDL